MKRDYIDVAVNAQFDRKLSLLRDVVRSGGRDKWSHLHSHGHKFPSVKHCVNVGYLKESSAYHYEITDAGKEFLADIDAERLRRS